MTDHDSPVLNAETGVPAAPSVEWKPRSAAPDDEVEIVGYQPELGAADEDEMPSHYGITTGKWLHCGGWGACTHWMSLPAAPQPERVSDRTDSNTDAAQETPSGTPIAGGGR